MRSHRNLVALIAGLWACAGGSIPAPPGGSVSVPGETALILHGRVTTFYPRLIQRRFNTLETFNDAVLRAHFRT